jgi:hypothetical protein
MEKGATYRKLLEQFIDELGQWDRPARDGEVTDLSSGEPVKGVRLMPDKAGEWVLWLICGSSQSPAFVLRQAGCFRDRRLGEIMAEYKLRQSASVSGSSRQALRDSDDYHLSDWVN